MDEERLALSDAKKYSVVTEEEAGFIVTVINKLRSEIDFKRKELAKLQIEIRQIKEDENTIIKLLQNMTAARERDEKRRQTIISLREKREELEGN